MRTIIINGIETILMPYIGYSREAGSNEGACLIFAPNCKEARKLAFDILQGWFTDQEWIDVAVSLLKGEHYYLDADLEKLKKNIPHTNDSPQKTHCKRCETWGHKLDENGECEECANRNDIHFHHKELAIFNQVSK
jgi:hypothetical protein